MVKKSANQLYLEDLEAKKEIEKEDYKSVTIALPLRTHSYIDVCVAKLGMSKSAFCAELINRNVIEFGQLLGVIDPKTFQIIDEKEEAA